MGLSFLLYFLKLRQVNKIIFLKDINYKGSDIGKEIYQFSDFYGKKKDLIKLLIFEKRDEFEFRTHDFYKTRWCSIYLILLFFNRSRSKYIVDNIGTTNINFFFIIKFIINIIGSILIQIASVFIYFLFLFIILIVPKKKLKNIEIKSLIFYRTNPVFNLTAGGSLGHILGVINGFLQNNINVSFIGIDKITGINKNIKTKIIHPRKYLFSLPIFSSMETSIRNFLISSNKKYFSDTDNTALYYRITAFDISPLLLKIFYKIPLIIEFNSFLEWEERNNGAKSSFKTKFISFVENLILKNASLIVCVSDELKNQLIKKGFNYKKIIYCSNGVDLNKFKSLEISKDLVKNLHLANHKVIGFVGTFGPWHGVELLCETITEFNKKNKKSKVKFLLVGDGSLRKFAEDYLSTFENVIFTGKVSYQKITDYLNLCDILISPHKLPSSEKVFIGSPTKLFEYLAMKKIVIGTDLGQIKEIISPAIDFTKSNKSIKINNLEVGIIANQTSNSLVEAIEFSLENHTKLEFLKENSYRKVYNEYTWERKIKHVLKSFHESNQ